MPTSHETKSDVSVEIYLR